MKKITLLCLSVLFSLTTIAQTDTGGVTLDTSGATDYYIQFGRAGGGNQGVIQDMGPDLPLKTAQASVGTESQLWSITIRGGKHVFTNKLGREIGYDATANLYQAAAADAGVIFNIVETTNETYPDSYELERDGESQHVNQNSGGGFNRTLGQWTANDQGNPLKFIKLADAEDATIGVVGGLAEALTSVLPTLDTYYYIQFTPGKGVLDSNGTLVSTDYAHENDDNQQWKITGTAGNYTITNKAGNILEYDGFANFTATAGGTTKFGLVENAPNWEIQRTGATGALNQSGGSGFGKTIAEWTIGDVNNVLTFVLPADIVYSPKISDGVVADNYYRIKFLSSNNYIQDMGDAEKARTQALDAANDAQLWKVTGSEEAMVLVSKNGLTLEYDEGLERYVTTSIPTPTPLGLKVSQNDTYPNGWEIQRVGESNGYGINQFGGGANAELGEWGIGDKNNPLIFTQETSVAAIADTSGADLDTSGATDYYIQFGRADGAGNQGIIQDMGEGVDLLTAQAVAATDSQIWNVTIRGEKYVFTNKLGREIGHNGSLFQAAAANAGVIFDIMATTNPSHPNSYELQRDGDTQNMNQNGGGGFNRTLGQWNANDQGNPLKFIKLSDAEDATIGIVGGFGVASSISPELDTYYYIQFTPGKGVLDSNGAIVKTGYAHEADENQQWKITGTAGAYTITNKAGNVLTHDGTNYTATADGTTTFELVENVPNWEIKRTGESQAMNQSGGSGFGKTIAEWTIGDVNNILKFVLPADMTYAPKISDGTTDYYYRMKFLSSDNYIQDMGDAEKARTQVLDATDDSQLWKVTGSEDAMVLVSKDGLTLEYDAGSSRYVTTSSPTPTLLKLKTSQSVVYPNGWEMQRDGETNGINQFGGGANAELGEWTIGDKNNPLIFISLPALADTSGTALDTSGATDYYIQFGRADGAGNQGVIEDLGVDVDLQTKKAYADTDSQLWNVTIRGGKHVFTNKLGREIGHNGSLFQATAANAGVIFDIIATTNETYPNSYELQRDGDTQNMNQNGGGGFNRTLGQWNANDPGNPLKFIKVADAEDATIGIVGGFGVVTSISPELDTYYYIQFTPGKGVLDSNGAIVKTGYAHEDDENQQWKITGAAGAYTITNKAGNVLTHDGTNYTATADGTTTFELVENVPNWEIKRTGESQAMNQSGGSGFGKTIAEWTIGDVNNILKFVLPADMTYAPIISDGTTDYYYRMKFLSSDNYIQDMGDAEKARTQALDAADDSQLWKVTGSEDAMVLVSKDGLTLEYDAVSSRYVTTSSPTPTLLKLKTSQSVVYPNAWEIQRDGETNGINQFGGGANAELGEWTIGDKNNPLIFILEGTELSVDNVSFEESIKLYPNPFNDTFSFSFKNTSASKAQVNIYSVTGKLVKSELLSLNNKSVTVNGRDLSTGFYIVEVKTSEGKARFKLLKQ
jgi:hypothetical protein